VIYAEVGSARGIALKAGVCHATAVRWLQEAHLVVQPGNRRPMPHMRMMQQKRRESSRFPCPFSAVELRRLYWDEEMTPKRIVDLAARQCGWEKVPAPSLAWYWIKRAGIQRRPVGVASQV
jgi:hypothetical protein